MSERSVGTPKGVLVACEESSYRDSLRVRSAVITGDSTVIYPLRITLVT
jgi:hypothetical protein